jgi:hypothetical protein
MLRPLAVGNQSLGADSKVSSTETKDTAAAREKAQVVVNGEGSSSNVPSGNKNLDISRHNLNLTESTDYSHSKLSFLPEQQQPERKILNTMRLSPAHVSKSDNEAFRSPRPLAGVAPPTSEDRACRFPPDNKENNASGYNQHRKLSSK